MQFNECMELMKRARLGKRKLGNNFYLTKDLNNTFHFIHHRTSIVKLSQKGTLTLNNNGWYSITTKKNLNKILRPYNFCIFQKNRVWYIKDLETSVIQTYHNNLQIDVESRIMIVER